MAEALNVATTFDSREQAVSAPVAGRLRPREHETIRFSE
jgi:hypothetical protein